MAITTETTKSQVPKTIARYLSVNESEVRNQLRSNGWVHLKHGMSDRFFEELQRQTKGHLNESGGDLSDWRFPGKKAQFLWSPPAPFTFDELRSEIAGLTGMNRATTTLAERHLKVYSPSAEDFPPPHKDRSASIFTVGFGVEIPAESRLVIWPETDRRPNPYPTSAEWRDSRTRSDLPEVVTKNHEPVEIDMRAGDVVIFRGSEIYHERFRPGGTAVLYLKFNDVGLDPLGEDPRTTKLEESSARLLAELPKTFEIQLSPRLVGMRTETFFHSGATHHQARFMGTDTNIALSD